MIKRRILLSGLALFFCAGHFAPSFAGWKRIGFEGHEITAITTGVDIWNNGQAIVIVGTKDSGVFSVSVPRDSVGRYPVFAYTASDKPAGVIRTLLISNDGIMAFAGTDSGLYGESMYFSSLPAWKKIRTFPSEPVVGIAYKDSTYCVATAKELYRSKSPWAYTNAWMPCSVSKRLPSPARSPNFTSLTSWGLNGFVAGSNAAAGSNTLGGVITGGGDANQWFSITCVNNRCVDSNVYSLTFSDFGLLFAGTSRGVYRYSTNVEMGVWYEMSPQLASPPVHHVLETYDSVSHAQEMYASTDSGVYILSPRINPNQWTLSLKVKAFGVVSPSPKKSNAVYAATADGVWKYEPTTGVGVVKVEKIPLSRNSVMGVYSLNGRKIASKVQLRRMTGIFITQQQNQKCKKFIAGMGNNRDYADFPAVR
jgi:hypothetical protein